MGNHFPQRLPAVDDLIAQPRQLLQLFEGVTTYPAIITLRSLPSNCQDPEPSRVCGMEVALVVNSASRSFGSPSLTLRNDSAPLLPASPLIAEIDHRFDCDIITEKFAQFFARAGAEERRGRNIT